ATQADAVGQTEAAAPEERPTAKTRAETGAEPEAVAAPEATAEAEAAPPTEQPAARPGGGSPDQETFDRVLEEQLAKGVDRRVAEGRARAAAIVAARKKAQT
ncbi:MAG: 2-oxoglutarate dehydrogenase, E2 component, dihydrolipoamide succinyltransferase, partial [Actinobacteria bacterium]|nr:2-oxoglutarate dehydrogenase, E2 component, dihydrolipoamide succinyltransferase [Actinomycetota bacterium]